MICVGRNTETGAASVNHTFVCEIEMGCRVQPRGDYWAVDQRWSSGNLLLQAFTWWDINTVTRGTRKRGRVKERKVWKTCKISFSAFQTGTNWKIEWGWSEGSSRGWAKSPHKQQSAVQHCVHSDRLRTHTCETRHHGFKATYQLRFSQS